MLAYLDTNIWVYAYENDLSFGKAAQQFMQSLRSGKHRVAGSLFVLNELHVLPTRRGDEFVIGSYRRLFASSSLEILPYTVASAQTYAQLRAFDRLNLWTRCILRPLLLLGWIFSLRTMRNYWH